MVASVATRGYAATRIADLIELSGVSSRSFYALFHDKDACLAATVDALALEASHPGDLVERIAGQPAAAELCLSAAYGGGPEVRKRLAELNRTLEVHAAGALRTASEDGELPEQMVSAGVGAVGALVQRWLRYGQDGDLRPQVDDLLRVLAASYEPPPEPLRKPQRRHAEPTEAPATRDHAERILRAVAVVAAKHGYANATIAQIVAEAGISTSRFYEHFESKEAALLAAIDSAVAQMAAAITLPLRRHPRWPQRATAAMGAFLNLLASRPAMANLVFVEVDGAGQRALERREEALVLLEPLWAEARRLWPQTSRVLLQAVRDSILYLIRKTLLEAGPAALPALAPTCTYLLLAPFVGPEAACAAANGGGRRSPSAVPEEVGEAAAQQLRSEIRLLLHRRPATVTDIASQLGQPEALIQRHLAALARAGDVYVMHESDQPGGNVYRSFVAVGEVHTEEWKRFSLAEREAVTARVVEEIEDDLHRSIDEGTFQERPEQVLVYAQLAVDERGWHELSELHAQMLAAAQAIQAESQRRLTRGGKEVDVRHVQVMFEMPPADQPSRT